MTAYGVWKDVSQIMSKDVAALGRRATVAKAAEMMTLRNISCVVVVEDDEPIGILTERDLLSKVVAQQRDPVRTPLEDVMSTPVASVPPNFSVFSASRAMEGSTVPSRMSRDTSTMFTSGAMASTPDN